MGGLIDITGQRFGRLTAVKRGPNAANTARTRRWWCICDCGERRLVARQDLVSGHTKSCGCLRRRRRPDAMVRLPEHAIWRGIINRCENAHVRCFPNYGGRGVSICPEWRRDFRAFLDHIGPRPSPNHSVERIDNMLGYQPGNVRWATPLEQANNRRCTRKVIYRGVEMPLADAVRAAGSVIHIEAAWTRIRHGWLVDEALETPRLHRSHAAKFGVVDMRAKTGLAGPQHDMRSIPA